MGQALYRKYRSKSLDEVVGQDHITLTLKNALKSGKISHAYLFTGPHGVGKTSVARILAHEINKLPYVEPSNHIDIIEIDAASNRRIDEIRDLRDKVYVAPTSASYKVYIIDEVHMLTREAFNALLKTLEEPPAHVIFILATTELHKLPQTIISRTQRFSFKPADKPRIIDLLTRIAKAEKIQISDDAIDVIAEHGLGSFRDSVSLLDQASSQATSIETSDVLSLLGIPPKDSVLKLLDLIARHGSTHEVLVSLSDLYNQGYQAAIITKQLSKILRDQLSGGTALLPSDVTLRLLGAFIDIPASHNPEQALEIALMKEVVSVSSIEPEPQRPAVKVKEDAAMKESKVDKPEEPLPKKEVEKVMPEKVHAIKSETPRKLDGEVWTEVLAQLKAHHNTLYGVIRMAQPEFIDDHTLRLTFSFAFHQKRIEETKNQKLLADLVEKITGNPVMIECQLNKNPISSPTPKVESIPPETTPDDFITISNIFGGGELLES